MWLVVMLRVVFSICSWVFGIENLFLVGLFSFFVVHHGRMFGIYTSLCWTHVFVLFYLCMGALWSGEWNWQLVMRSVVLFATYNLLFVSTIPNLLVMGLVEMFRCAFIICCSVFGMEHMVLNNFLWCIVVECMPTTLSLESVAFSEAPIASIGTPITALVSSASFASL